MEKHVRYKYKNKKVKEQRFGDDQRWVISCSRFRKRKTQNQERYLRCAPEGLSFLHHFLNFHLFLPSLLFSDRYFHAHSRSRLSLFGTVNSQNGDFSKKMKYSNTVVDSPTRPTDFLLHVMSISSDAPSHLTYWDYLRQTHRAPSLNSARKKLANIDTVCEAALTLWPSSFYYPPTPTSSESWRCSSFLASISASVFTEHRHLDAEGSV